MMHELKKKVTKMMAGVLCMAVLLLAVVPFTQAEASSKAVAKKSITISLDKKHPIKYCMLYTVSTDTESEISIKITGMKGKPKKEKLDFLFYSFEDYGSSALWLDDVRSSKMKKGAKLPLDRTSVLGRACIEFELPEGVKSITYKVTFSDAENKKTIKNVTLEKSRDTWDEYWTKTHKK